MAFDFGIKRTGIAVTDEGRIIATALDTVETQSIAPFIADYVSKNKVDVFVIGLPKTLNNQPAQIENDIGRFIQQLNTKFPGIPVERMDERFTSSLALDAMIQAGSTKKQRQNKSNLDKISAVIILQSYLQSRNL
jgi:putative holliday junction resolvase